MSWGFERDKRYNRQNDIHGKFAGQEQGGIITPADHKVVIAITGDRGKQHGYADERMSDGSYHYFGAGRNGDMKFRDRNRRLYEHSADGKSLLLFKEERRELRFLGEYVCEGYDERQAPGENKKMRKAIVFHLRPLENINEEVDTESAAEPGVSDEELEKRAFAAAKPQAGKSEGKGRANIYERSKDVRNWVLRRAKGKCEYDGAPAPFLRADGEPYLEPHHIYRVSDGGPDDPRTVIALCPNCHRRAHSGVDKTPFNKELLAKIKTIQLDPKK
ncbi:HNH endonuclease [Rhizobium jaguaris]|uniref:HNH endonuclease n=1 Tax=Rhizobium jaguaris TaxID=1312183 RepID=A0A387FJY2_9HYPH|nr:HNH endonuclease signature motif containing protein [Rhizobium jaguaris]AYG59680.1 HNH endonuclease [Rhizobium jaguaris]